MGNYQEASIWGKEQIIYAVLILAVLLAWLGWQVWNYSAGTGSFGAIIYVLAFVGLWAWRFAFRYTYILTDRNFVVVTSGWGLERRLVIDLESVESIANKYHKRFFQKTGIKKYIYRYSSGDPRSTRILVLNQGGKLHGVLFKVSDEFIGQMRELMPARILELE